MELAVKSDINRSLNTLDFGFVKTDGICYIQILSLSHLCTIQVNCELYSEDRVFHDMP